MDFGIPWRFSDCIVCLCSLVDILAKRRVFPFPHLFIHLLILMRTCEFLFHSSGYNLLVLLFILMLKWSQTWPVWARLGRLSDERHFRPLLSVTCPQLCNQPFSRDPWFLSVMSPNLLLLIHCSLLLVPQKWLEWILRRESKFCMSSWAKRF